MQNFMVQLQINEEAPLHNMQPISKLTSGCNIALGSKILTILSWQLSI